MTDTDRGDTAPDPRPAPPDLEWLRSFVNSDNRYYGVDYLRVEERAELWARHNAEVPVDALDDAAWSRLIGLRDAVRGLLEGAPGAGPALAEHAARYPLVLGPGGPGELVAARAGQETVAAASVLAPLHRASVDGRLRRLRLCQRPDCGWCYYDSSRNGSARWCSAEPCGDVMKTRAFRDRQRQAR